MRENHSGKNYIEFDTGATPLTIADCIIREVSDPEWIEDVIYYLGMYLNRAYSNSIKKGDD